MDCKYFTLNGKINTLHTINFRKYGNIVQYVFVVLTVGLVDDKDRFHLEIEIEK